MDKKNALIGAGGFAKEVASSMKSDYGRNIISVFFVEDHFYDKNKINDKYYSILPLSEFSPDKYRLAVAIGNPQIRKRIVENLPTNTEFITYISSKAIIGSDVQIGEGSIVCAGTIVTTNVIVGKHSHLNLHTSIGHDTVVANYFTSAPGARISGNCIIGECVYLGTNSSIKEGLEICDNVVVGLNAGVVKNIKEKGTYVGVPSKKIK